MNDKAVDDDRQQRPYWRIYLHRRDHALPPGQDLAGMRRGIGHGPMESPSMWGLYSCLDRSDGRVTAELAAEHVALSLFGVHQQSQSRLMHWPGVGVGDALSAMRRSGRYSEAALDRRVTQAATAHDLREMSEHLRGLITMLKSLPQPQGLDYDRLVLDLVDWQRVEGAARVRRRWGLQYFRPVNTDKEQS